MSKSKNSQWGKPIHLTRIPKDITDFIYKVAAQETECNVAEAVRKLLEEARAQRLKTKGA